MLFDTLAQASSQRYAGFMRRITLFLVIGALGSLSGCADSTPQGARQLGTGTPDTGGVAVASGGQSASGGQLATGGVKLGGTGGSLGGGGADCKVGHYVGNFDGRYRSQVWGNGDPMFELHVQGLADPVMGVEPLEFDLVQSEAESCGASEEFCGGYKVEGGKMMGGADPFDSGLLSVHFEIDLTGDLDCRTGEFRGRLENGFYDVAGAKFYFEGDIVGQYDNGTFSFGPGTWDVVEDPGTAIIPPDQSIGGSGTWEASLVTP